MLTFYRAMFRQKAVSLNSGNTGAADVTRFMTKNRKGSKLDQACFSSDIHTFNISNGKKEDILRSFMILNFFYFKGLQDFLRIRRNPEIQKEFHIFCITIP